MTHASWKEPWDIVWSLLKGLGITLRQLVSKPCTLQYPEERQTWPDRSRGRLVLPVDPATGKDRCTVCMSCQRICPNGSIEITAGTSEAGKRALADFVYHLERCTFCGLCVEACPFDALRLSHEHEIAVRDRGTLTLHLQTERPPLRPEWRGGLPAKADVGAAPAAGGAA